MADTRRGLETAVFDLAARLATVRAALSAAITNDVDRDRPARRAGGLLPRTRRCHGLDVDGGGRGLIRMRSGAWRG